jgi:chloramphenicol-sensitive protein RarD
VTIPSGRKLAGGTLGGTYASLAYFMFAVSSAYWKMLKEVPALEILCYRVLMSLILLAAVLAVQGQVQGVLNTLRDRRTLLVCIASAIALTGNWGTFVWGSIFNHVIETSIGYFLVPVVNIMLGVLLLKERLSGWRIVALVLVLASVINLLMNSGDLLPWVYLTIALSFGCYGFFRKIAPLGAVAGTGIDTLLLALPALVALGWSSGDLGQLKLFTGTWPIRLLILGAGIVSVVPMLLFTRATRILKLSTMGFFQYIMPSTQLVLAVAFFKQTITRSSLISFALIWTSLALVSIETYLRQRAPAPAVVPAISDGAVPKV